MLYRRYKTNLHKKKNIYRTLKGGAEGRTFSVCQSSRGRTRTLDLVLSLTLIENIKKKSRKRLEALVIWPVPWKTYREIVSFEDFIFILAYPVLFTGTKALQSRKTKALRQFQKAFSLKTEGWSVSRLRCKILLECLKKLGLQRLAEKAFQWDQHTQRALLYNRFSLSTESVRWRKNLIGFMSAASYLVCQTPTARDGGLLSSSSLEEKGEQFVAGQWCFFPLGKKWKKWENVTPALAAEENVVWSCKMERCSWACYHSGCHHTLSSTELGIVPIFSWFQKNRCNVELHRHYIVR